MPAETKSCGSADVHSAKRDPAKSERRQVDLSVTPVAIDRDGVPSRVRLTLTGQDQVTWIDVDELVALVLSEEIRTVFSRESELS